MVPDKRTIIRYSLLPLLGAAAIALGAWFSFPVPGTDVPQTGQTIAVLVCGALLGSRGGTLAVLAYLLLGALGLPIYSDGGSGWAALFGSNAGYFVGFVAGAALCGGLVRRLHARLPVLLGAMLAGHGVILALGWARLALALGPAGAWLQGVQPFLYGGLVKSMLAAAGVAAVGLIVQRQRPAAHLP